jgi:release factor glutamine methyltransferase
MTDPTRRALRSAATHRLRAAGVATPEVDAALLLAHVLGLPRSRLDLGTAMPSDTAAAFEIAVARREQREPLQHIVGDTAFRHVVVRVGPGVFVPRPETELLIDAVLPTLSQQPRPIAVDLCSGSGALALAIRDEVPAATVYAVENAPAALDWLRRNTAGRAVEVVAGDVRSAEVLAQLRGTVDAVVSNPPYVPAATKVAPEVLADPADAVFAGPDGLAVLPEVLARAAELLRPGGVLAVEHDDAHADAVNELLEQAGTWTDIADHRDLAGRSRYAVAKRAGSGTTTG